MYKIVLSLMSFSLTNFHQISHWAFCRRGFVNLFKWFCTIEQDGHNAIFKQIFSSRTKKALRLTFGILYRKCKSDQVSSNDVPMVTFELYISDPIEFPGKYESRYGNGAVIELDNKSTLNLTMDLQVRNGYVYPIVMWKNPPVEPPRGQSYLMYRIDYYLQNCACDLPSDHFSDYGTFELNERVCKSYLCQAIAT